ncbi:MAG: hypothetical protein DDT34_02122 [Firmicutes bacterium]|nr:hypothetical protein [Bacillota bacterium]
MGVARGQVLQETVLEGLWRTHAKDGGGSDHIGIPPEQLVQGLIARLAFEVEQGYVDGRLSGVAAVNDLTGPFVELLDSESVLPDELRQEPLGQSGIDALDGLSGHAFVRHTLPPAHQGCVGLEAQNEGGHAGPGVVGNLKRLS